MSEIKSIAVIGAGVMGAGIAAHFANAGVKVHLIDVPSKGLFNKNAIAIEAIEKILKTDPAPLMHKEYAKLIIPGNTDDLEKISECDWVIEAIVEKKDIKQDLYKKLAKVCGAHTIFSSNTSTIPLKDLMEGMDSSFQERFLITHFFNPPRYMRLLELVKGPKTKSEIYDRVCHFADRSLGKVTVDCHDSPGFIANRIGTFWIQYAFKMAIDHAITVEEADAVLGKPLGIPKTGVFALMDLVGLDLMPLIGKSMNHSLPETDLYRKTYFEPEFIHTLIAEGYTGRKGKGGFYRIQKEGDKKVKQSLDLQTGAYKISQKPRLACLDVSKEGPKRFLSYADKGGRYGLEVISKVLWYAASLLGEVADSIEAIDQAMKLGYNWKFGPFELMDRIGVDFLVGEWEKAGLCVPAIATMALKNQGFYKTENGVLMILTPSGSYVAQHRKEGQILLSDVKRRSKPLLKNASACVWDLGDGVLCFEFISKMNAIDGEIFKLLLETIELVKKEYKALVIHNEGSNFSVGANIGLALFAVNLGIWPQIEDLVATGQKTYKALKYAPFPVIGAPSGMALGGGCEVLLHCDAIQAHSELYMGLVEVGVGLVPAWGGCKEMLTRWLSASKRPGGAMVALSKVFEMIGTAKVAKSAREARDYLFLREHDSITMNKDWVLTDAKAKALDLAENYVVPEEIQISLPGAMARVAMTMAVKGFVKAGKATAYDEVVSTKLAEVLSGGDTDITDKQKEDDILALERAAFMSLIKRRETLDRIEHTLTTGKPLRN